MMKTLGLLGGMSWESTANYYKWINEAVRRSMGGLHSAKCILHSVDFHEIEQRQQRGDWRGCAQILRNAARGLEAAGAQALVLCTNTMHKVAEEMLEGVTIPLIHIGDVTAEALLRKGCTAAALLGTRYTMEQPFYRERLEQKGVRVFIPSPEEREELNRIIFEELCLGVQKESSKAYFIKVMERLRAQGAEGAILGCTEIGMLVHEGDTTVPLFDTTRIHAAAAADFIMGKERGMFN